MPVCDTHFLKASLIAISVQRSVSAPYGVAVFYADDVSICGTIEL